MRTSNSFVSEIPEYRHWFQDLTAIETVLSYQSRFFILSIGAAVRMEWFGCSVDVVTHSFLIYIDSIMFLRHHSDSLVAVAGTVSSCRQHITSIIPDAHTMIE